MNIKSPEQLAAKQLSSALVDRLATKTTNEVAATAHVQSVLTKSAVQALIEMLVHKGIISQSELAGALAYQYERSHGLIQSQEERIVTPDIGPTVKPV